MAITEMSNQLPPQTDFCITTYPVPLFPFICLKFPSKLRRWNHKAGLITRICWMFWNKQHQTLLRHYQMFYLPKLHNQCTNQTNQPTYRLPILKCRKHHLPQLVLTFVTPPSSTKRYVVTIPAQQLQMLNRDLADTQQITHVQFKTLTIQSFLTNLGSYSISTRRDELYR